MQIKFCYPNKTISVSLTGNVCQLNCAHCGGFYLKSMLTKSLALKRVSLNNVTSCLISGGCSSSGKVPIKENWSFIKDLKKRGLKLNLHTGIADKETIEKLKQLECKVSLDYVIDKKTIQIVYKLDPKKMNYTKLLEKMVNANLDVIPHILLGINRGKIASEYEAIDTLKNSPLKEVVFLIFKPAKGTQFEKYSAPELSEVEKVFNYARSKLKDKLLCLGCMRPHKSYREDVDLLALKSGFNKIVMPSKKAYEHALASGMKIDHTYECCCFN